MIWCDHHTKHYRQPLSTMTIGLRCWITSASTGLPFTVNKQLRFMIPSEVWTSRVCSWHNSSKLYGSLALLVVDYTWFTTEQLQHRNPKSPYPIGDWSSEIRLLFRMLNSWIPITWIASSLADCYPLWVFLTILTNNTEPSSTIIVDHEPNEASFNQYRLST